MIIKFQKPIKKTSLDYVIAHNEDHSFRSAIVIDENNQELINQVFTKENELISYCKCEVIGDKIVKVLEHVKNF